MPASSTKAKKGKEFEGKLIDKIKNQTKKLGIKFLRLYDSYAGFSKGSFVRVTIPGQPCDFIFTFSESKCCFVEFKYTESGTFHLTMLSDTQREGLEDSLNNDYLYFVLMYSETESLYYILSAKKISDLNPKRVASREFKLSEHFSEDSFSDHKLLFPILKEKYNLHGSIEQKVK